MGNFSLKGNYFSDVHLCLRFQAMYIQSLPCSMLLVKRMGESEKRWPLEYQKNVCPDIQHGSLDCGLHSGGLGPQETLYFQVLVTTHSVLGGYPHPPSVLSGETQQNSSTLVRSMTVPFPQTTSWYGWISSSAWSLLSHFVARTPFSSRYSTFNNQSEDVDLSVWPCYYSNIINFPAFMLYLDFS